MPKNNPVIKWSGSKRLLASRIISFFPKQFGNYFEPFLGGGSILLELAPQTAICCDINESLIDFWNRLKDNPTQLAKEYEENWLLLQQDWKHFLRIRERYNQFHSGSDLLFLSRTCVNGLIRYNKAGEFNNSLHYSRPGVNPERLKKTLIKESEKIQRYKFLSGDYRQILPDIRAGDLIYLDPPYANTKSMYYGKIDYEELWDFVRKAKALGAFVALSFDGTTEKRDYSVDIPGDLFARHVLLESGLSTFNKVIDGVQNGTKESLFLTY